MSDVEGLLERCESWLSSKYDDFERMAAAELIRDLANHIKSNGWRPISEYERPKDGDGEKVLLGHWVDYGKEEYYFGAPNWM